MQENKTEPDVELVTFIVDKLVDSSDCYDIERSIDERGVLITVNINRGMAGRIIGKRGDTANSIRTLLRSLGSRYGARYNLKINERDAEV